MTSPNQDISSTFPLLFYIKVKTIKSVLYDLRSTEIPTEPFNNIAKRTRAAILKSKEEKAQENIFLHSEYNAWFLIYIF